jgi:hypothetical protein
VTATRYVTPLREGGSLPALVEADDDGLYVLKFRGAGQGPKALIAEYVVGELARAVGLPVPELVLIDLDPSLGDAEPDPEIHDLIRASGGLNAGLDFLPGALPFSPAAGPPPDPDLAAELAWFDALVTNPDRTVQNPNLLTWHGRLWLIDHGAALYVHHHWANATPEKTRGPFPLVANHVLLGGSDGLEEVDDSAAAAVGDRVLEEILSALPDELLTGPQFEAEGDPSAHRRRYHHYLTERLRAPRAFVTGAVEARERLRRTTPQRRAARR